MDDDNFAVAGGLDIKLKGISAESQATLKGNQGILRRETRSAAMRKKERLIMYHVRAPRPGGGARAGNTLRGCYGGRGRERVCGARLLIGHNEYLQQRMITSSI